MWIKLLLDPSQDSFPKALLATSMALMPKDKEPVDAVTDYLSALKNHIATVFEGHYGKAFMKSTTIEYFLTVPAVSAWREHSEWISIQIT